MSTDQDSYARLPFRSDRARRALDIGGSLTFLDLADSTANLETATGYLREVPLDFLGRRRWVLIRWGPEHQGWHPATDAAGAFQDRLQDVGSNARAGVVVFEIGRNPRIAWSEARTSTPADASTTIHHGRVLLARARAVETAAFIDWGHALWQPRGYHYALPSGKHTRSFVRLADAFQDMRAAAALSTWLYGALDNETPTSLIMDVGTLMPLVLELQIAAERHRYTYEGSTARVGDVLALDRYPSTSLGLQRSLLRMSPNSPILGLVSVTDSGGFAERLLNACTALRVPHARIEQLVSRQLASATHLPIDFAVSENSEGIEATSDEDRSGAGDLDPPRWTIEDPWLSLGEFEAPGSESENCALCRDPSTARLVRIHPRAMSAMVLPEPELVVPDVFEARRNASIWGRYASLPSADSAVNLLGPAGTRTGSPSERVVDETVFFEPTEILKAAPSDLISLRSAEFNDYPKRSRDDVARERVQSAWKLVATNSDIVVYETQERQLYTEEQWTALCEALVEHQFVSKKARWLSYSSGGALQKSEDLSEADVLSVLVLACGARTGLSCQRMFLAARQRWPNASFCGLVVHAHPEDDRVWTSIRNTFTDANGEKRLLALWLTYLPDWSPLADERDTYLAAQQRGLNSPELAARLQELTAMEEPDGTVSSGCTLLGRIGPSLQPHSYLGSSLGSRETLCAVGASMQAARVRTRSRVAPHWTQFDLRKVLRSYFDGLIHVCVLRWCQPHEAWWGPQPTECPGFLQELEAVNFDFNLLLPELLLACAQEKLPTEAMAHLIEVAKHRLSSPSLNLDARTKDHLGLGVSVCELVLGESLTRPCSTG